MNKSPKVYDEGDEKAWYLFRHFPSLFTEDEKRAPCPEELMKHIPGLSAEEAQAGSDGALEDLSDSLATKVNRVVGKYRDRSVQRVLLEHAELVISRCRQCQNILPSPESRQCLWCKADWHEDV